MDRLTISSSGSLGADYQGLAGLKKRNSRGTEDDFSLAPGANQAEGKTETPAETSSPGAPATASAVAKDLAQDLPPLGKLQARQVLDNLAPTIAQTHPWKLAEIQAVAERSLIPTAYV